MNIFIYNVHKDQTFKEALNKAFVQKELQNGLNRSIECEVIASMGGYYFKDVSATDNEIIIRILNNFRNRYHVYFRIINFGVEMKFVNITKDFKTSTTVEVTKELVNDLNTKISGNFENKSSEGAPKKEKIRKLTVDQLMSELTQESKLDIKHDGIHVRSLGVLNGSKVIVSIPESSEIHIESGKFTTNNDNLKKMLIEKGFVENV